MTRIGKTFEQELDNNVLADVDGGWTPATILTTISTSSLPCTVSMAGSASLVSAVSVVSYTVTR